MNENKDLKKSSLSLNALNTENISRLRITINRTQVTKENLLVWETKAVIKFERQQLIRKDIFIKKIYRPVKADL
jgi:hypothetical protein